MTPAIMLELPRTEEQCRRGGEDVFSTFRTQGRVIPDGTVIDGVSVSSSGIGEATVRALRAHGVEVHAVARRSDRLEQLASECGSVSHVLDGSRTRA